MPLPASARGGEGQEKKIENRMEHSYANDNDEEHGCPEVPHDIHNIAMGSQWQEDERMSGETTLAQEWEQEYTARGEETKRSKRPAAIWAP